MAEGKDGKYTIEFDLSKVLNNLGLSCLLVFGGMTFVITVAALAGMTLTVIGLCFYMMYMTAPWMIWVLLGLMGVMFIVFILLSFNVIDPDRLRKWL